MTIAPIGWRKGSWRGLAFVSLGHEAAGGRRGALHEFPGADTPVWEDLGKAAGRFTLDCHIRGANHIAEALAFFDALNAAGPGTLVHPWHGPMQVAVASFSRRDSTDEGGYSAFSIEFVESGLPAPAAPAEDTRAQSRAAAQAASEDAAQAMAGDFDLAGAQSWVEEHAAGIVAAAADAMAIVAGLQGGIGPGLAAIQAHLGVLPADIQAKLRDPLALAQSINGAVQSIRAVAGSSIGVAGGLIALLGFGGALPPVIGDTAARSRQRSNQAALVQMVNAAAAGELAATIAGVAFASYPEAVALRDAAADALDALETRQADAGDDAGAGLYAALRRAIVRDITARGGTLARLQDYVPAVTEPALVIAHRLYGPDALEAREADLVARNRIAHPGFVPGGAAIQVVVPAGLADG
ncbi:DNA circularization protein [Sphingomonas canadensis]|uniref:DNA circularization protein n=1 Tax=Sphingomonas canadensis TaxID=1219257 RepID=A0ABW3H418_9SPHN|nr:DNA circularization N-terminal domain-containing protein [Sphingomonas canadensis]MCW3835966.1 DNA circularization N-terminal domain-containing protein [Sphingomonas canadensis]